MHPSGQDSELGPAGDCVLSVLPSIGLKDTPTQEDWLVSVLPEGSKVGVDPLIIPTGEWAWAFPAWVRKWVPGASAASLFVVGCGTLRDAA